jgi:hypothetical protein
MSDYSRTVHDRWAGVLGDFPGAAPPVAATVREV